MNYLQKKALQAQINARNVITKAQAVLKNEDGLSHSTEILVWTLSAVVLVGALTVLAVALFTDDIFPALGDKMKDILNL